MRIRTKDYALPLGLGQLLASLRLQGLPLGPREYRLLAHALRRTDLDGPQGTEQAPPERGFLRDLLVCTLAVDDQQQGLVEREFDTWWLANRSSLKALLPEPKRPRRPLVAQAPVETSDTNKPDPPSVEPTPDPDEPEPLPEPLKAPDKLARFRWWTELPARFR